MNDIRERLARALCEQYFLAEPAQSSNWWAETDQAEREQFLEAADAALAQLPLTQAQLEGLVSGDMVVVPKPVLDAAVKRANYDYQECYVQADPDHFHMQRREAIFELRKHTDPYNASVGFATAQEEQP